MLNWKDLELITVPSASLREVINHPETLNTHSAIICCSAQISLYETVKGGRICCLLMAQRSKLRFHALTHNKTPTFPHFYSWCQGQGYFLGKIHRQKWRAVCDTSPYTAPYWLMECAHIPTHGLKEGKHSSDLLLFCPHKIFAWKEEYKVTPHPTMVGAWGAQGALSPYK